MYTSSALRSGDLTSTEFLQGVRAMGFLNATEAEAKFVWQWLDKDGDGVIPYKELDKRIRPVAAWRQRRRGPGQALRCSPRTRSGQGIRHRT